MKQGRDENSVRVARAVEKILNEDKLEGFDGLF